MKYKVADAPITFEEIVIVMIKGLSVIFNLHGLVIYHITRTSKGH